jgi:UTP--glucose-1-phosphate uridylyltransferase
MVKVRKAVIAAAGMGTRFLPQTKAMPKEMLPIIDKPVIQLVVEGLVAAGVEDIIIVTGPTKRAIEDHFDRSLELEEALVAKGKSDIAEQLKSIANMANFIYVRQKGLPAGNARPIINASHIVGDEPFFFFFADDFFAGEKSTAQQLLEVYKKTGGSVVALREVPESEVSSYGVADVKEVLGSGLVSIKGITEKPAIEDAPSNLAVGSGYLLTPAVIKIVEREIPGVGNEIGIADSIAELAQSENVTGLTIKGDYHDTGNPEAYLHTLISLALKDKRYGENLRKFLQKKLA